MEHPLWFYGKFLGLLGIVSLMVAFNFLTWGFHRPRRQTVWQVPGAHPERGPALIKAYGCNACHIIPSSSATPRIGPSLEHLPEQLYLAGTLPNTPTNLIRWIQEPDVIRHGTAMPNLHVGADDARDIAAYLFNQPAGSQ
jgi:cytochrome c